MLYSWLDIWHKYGRPAFSTCVARTMMQRTLTSKCRTLRAVHVRSFADQAAEHLTISSDDVKNSKLLLSTRDWVEGREVIKEIGIVTASHVRTKNILEDIIAAFGGAMGGETRSYTSLLNDTTTEAVHRLKAAALVGHSRPLCVGPHFVS
ncbi:Aste57867_9624 [Aphanomyces stellatus]|uniref:Aste57867_9624 protein n=1 Tax=Aphanomyces stellatus TaxID=120398 RepID=A0A485KNN4_9STRA|nr:hypothetical protein As57867_009586 [Aphanomyces stellatus]VFT86503.1 Aste57867_9624 [Aphanomyces stellatus]